MKMSERTHRAFLLLVATLLLVPIVAADYSGSSLAVKDSGSVTGDVRIEYGTSTYSGEMAPGGTHSVTFPVSVPPGATIKSATIYLFWTWSHDGTEGAAPSIQTRASGTSITPLRSYSDRKGSGTYDYPSGTYVYNVASTARANSPLTLTVTNGAPTAGFAVSGAVLLLAYNGGSTGARYWVAEGADMIYATGGVSPGAATTRVTFSNVPTVSAGTTADLISVVPSGNKGANTLSFNGQQFSGLLNGRPYPDLAVISTPVGPYLKAGQNTVMLRDEGDYMVPGVFLLRVAGSGGTSNPMVTTATTAKMATATTTEQKTTTQTATMTTIVQTTPSSTVPTGTLTPGTTMPTMTVSASISSTTVPESTNPPASMPTDGQNSTPQGAPTPVVITASPTSTTGNTTAVSTSVPYETPDTPVVITPPTTIPVTTETTLDLSTEATTEATTITTTEPTTETTTVATIATVAEPVQDDHVVLYAPPGLNDLDPVPEPSSNASAAAIREGGSDPVTSLLPGETDLPAMGIILFGVVTGAGILISSAIAGAGIISYLARPRERPERRSGRTGPQSTSMYQQPASMTAPRRFDDDR
ncbi:hypothetical protein DSECCO2_388750 [anaerobic digester metagenome]